MQISIEKLANIIEADITNCSTTTIEINHVSIDSRSMVNTAKTLFFALKGKLTHGHSFIEDLKNQDVSFFVVEKPMISDSKNIYFVVKNSLRAFQKFAKYHREQFNLPIIGITGSKGKTIVKEWISDLLSEEFNIIKSPKNYNSQIGVALSVLEINKQHNLGIFQAGISKTNEMNYLEQILQPTIGVFTNIDATHSKEFSSDYEKITEKLKLFKNTTVIIIPNDINIKKHITKDKQFVWGFSNDCDVYFKELSDSSYTVTHNAITFDVKLPFTDQELVNDLLTCIATLLYLNTDTQNIQTKLPNLAKLNIRLELKKGIYQSLLIDDSYLSDYQSLSSALDFLDQQKKSKSKTIILSDIEQSGLENDVLYKRIAQLIKGQKINKVIGIGDEISKYLPKYSSGVFFKSTYDFLEQYNFESFQNETILIKGSREFYFDKIVEFLEEKKHETILEVNLDAITHNYTFYKNRCKPSTKIMVMLKAFGYGYGGYEIARQLEYLNASMFGVAFADEGVQLRKAGIKTPIMVMNPEVNTFQQMIHYNLEPEIYSVKVMKLFIKELEKCDKTDYPIHLKLNTGMNRLGLKTDELNKVLNILKQSNRLKTQTVFSHLAAANDLNKKAFTLQQIQCFNSFYDQIKQNLGYQPIRHILNTSGIYNFTEHQMDMVRLGIGLYGLANHPIEQKQLKTVGTLKTKILQTQKVNTNESVGYSRGFLAKKPTTIAILPIGYADGIRRSYGNHTGLVYIKGKKYPIIGNVCMDMLMVDIGNDMINAGDDVEIFGTNITVSEIAEKWDTIHYEVITSISNRVNRVFYKK